MRTDKNFQELSRLKTFDERFAYLKLDGQVGIDVFGQERRLNQFFYRSQEWHKVKRSVILRDLGLDLGCQGYEIMDRALVHHMNPIAIEDLVDFNPDVLNPDYLITTSVATHLSIHYGDRNLIPRLSMERKPGDTKLW